jgi:hypothetical protein
MTKPTTVHFDLVPQAPGQDTSLIGVDAGTPAGVTAPASVVSWDVAHAANAMFSRTTLLSHADFSLTVPYVVKGWFFAGQTSVVYAPSNAGKTSWVLDITRAITADEDWHGYQTRKGGAVLYIAAEAPGSIYRRTVLFPDASKDRFIVLGEPIDLVGDPAAGDKIATLAALCEERYGLKITLIVVDTLTLCFGDGDENSTRDAGRAVAAAKVAAAKTGAHVMLVHHTGKDRSAGARGSYAITGNSDTVIELVPQEGQEKNVVALQRKQREAATDEALAFRIIAVDLGTDEDGDPITTSGIEVIASNADARRLIARNSADRGMVAVLAALRALEVASDAGQTGFTAAEIAEACAQTFKPGYELESRKKAVRGVLKQAAEAASPTVVKQGDRYRTVPAADGSA